METILDPEEQQFPQTETEEPIEARNSAEESPEKSTDSGDSQTEPEIEGKPPKPRARTRKTKAAESESDTETVNALDHASNSDPEQKKSSPVRPSRRVVAIDATLGVETDEQRAEQDLIDLMESLRAKRILTGTIQGVERPSDHSASPHAVIYHGDYKIVIPAEEAVLPPDDLRGLQLNDVYHYLLTKRLGAEVDYIVKGVDPKTGIAAASRLEAMAAKRKAYYFGTDRNGNWLLYEGACAEARVVSVIRAGIFVDVFGLESYIPLRELSYQRMLDAQTAFQPGQRILVKILALDRTDPGSIRLSVSIKQAGENPYTKALRRYTVGDRYVGTVSVVDTNGIFVSLGEGVDCLCSYPKRGRPPRGARVTVRILGINHETNRIWGAITHSAMPG